MSLITYIAASELPAPTKKAEDDAQSKVTDMRVESSPVRPDYATAS